MAQLFQLQEAEELDFGFYRIIKRHNRKVREFLGEIDPHSGELHGGELAGLLSTAFQRLEDNNTQEKKLALQDLGKKLGIAPHLDEASLSTKLAELENTPLLQPQVATYRELRSELYDTHSAHEDRAEVLNRLYEFYARHYQSGDFIVQRRYGKNGARYIKSTGDDIEFRWATEDMYYIKSGDVFTDYSFVLSNGRRMVFCLDADSVQRTRAELKPTDRAHYVRKGITKQSDGTQGELRVELFYRKGAQKKTQLDDIAQAAATFAEVPVEQIARHLRHFIARNQSDFFIHKRLREALDEDLDIFLKAEVLNADQLLAEDAAVVAGRALRVARITRQLARRINAFLGVLEDHQKRLWEKKKLVLDTRYVITLNRLERDAAAWLAANIEHIVDAQRNEWKALGLGEYPSVAACKRVIAGDLVSDTSERYLPLPVDTGLFNDDFKWSLLAAVTANRPLDEALDGIAIRSDNWQALNTLQAKYRNRVKCIYIDPPYNTGSDGFPYKDAYQHASWLAMIENRLVSATPLLRNTGVLFASIDAVEQVGIRMVLDKVFGAANHVEEIIWAQSFTKNQSPTYSTNHEYIEVYARNLEAAKAEHSLFRINKPGARELMAAMDEINHSYPTLAEIERKIGDVMRQLDAKYRAEIEEAGVEWNEDIEARTPYKGIKNYKRAEYRDAIGVYVESSHAASRQAKIWVWYPTDASMPAGKQADSTRDPGDPNYRFYAISHPVTDKPCDAPNRGWAWPKKIDPDNLGRPSFAEKLADHRIAWGENETTGVLQKTFLHETLSQPAPSVLNEFSRGDKQLAVMFGKEWNLGAFPNPKPTKLVGGLIHQSSGDGDYVLDFFGGSGSTWHAAVDAKALDGARRKVILVESAGHFDLVLLPRIKKVIASTDWGQRGGGANKKGKNGVANQLDGPGGFLRVQRLEQYEDALENLALEQNESASLFDGAEALAYQLDDALASIALDGARFTRPFGATLKHIEEASIKARPVDLVESLVFLLGLHVDRLYREDGSVVMTGRRNGSGEAVTVLWRDNMLHGKSWIQGKLAAHPADRIYTNEPWLLAFEGAECFQAIESVFVEGLSGRVGEAW